MRKQMIIFLVGMPVAVVFKIYMILIVVLQPGSSMDTFILVQRIVITITDLLVVALVMVLGVKRLKSFKHNIYSLIRRASDDALRSPFK